jgi:hypothetical protein
MTKLERGLLITLVTIIMIAWAIASAYIADASIVGTVGAVKPLKYDTPSEPLERVPEPAFLLEGENTGEDVYELSEASRGVVGDSENVEEFEEVEPEPTYFDVPLSHELQDHLRDICEDYGVDMAVVIAMIEKESNFDIYALGDNGRALGLMQIHPRWHGARMAKLECWDLMDPYQNLTVAVDLIAELAASGNSIEWVLMAYNGGEAYADRKAAAGEVSEYARDVLAGSEEYKVK